MCYLLWGTSIASLQGEFIVEQLLPENGGNGSLGLIFEGGEPGADIGFNDQFSGHFDINGDGVSDLVFGSPRMNGEDGTYQTGRVYVVYGSESPSFVKLNLADLATASPGPGQLGFVLKPESLANPPASGNFQFGIQVSPAGDVNGDGIDDLLIGEQGHRRQNDPTAPYACGAAWIVYGRDASDGGFPPLSYIGATAMEEGRVWGLLRDEQCQTARFGGAIATLPDFTSDGRPEWLIGAYSAGGYGLACLYLSSEAPHGIPLTEFRTVETGSRATWLGLGLLVLALGGFVLARRG